VSSLRIGIDLGGTKIEGIALDGSREAARVRLDTPRDDYAATLDAIGSLVADLERRAAARGTVGIGIPGTLSPATGLVKNANSVWLLGKPLKADLEARLGREVRMANDANCFAVSEAADGAAAGADVVFGVIVGTGTGAGITVRGRVLIGPNGIAGEWGHNPLPWATGDEVPGPRCYCGRHGCVETFLSGPGMAMDHERRSGRREPAPAIVASAEAGHAAAQETVSRYEHRMARALAGVINMLDPDVIVLGGGMSNIDRLYDNVPRLWGDYVFAASTPNSTPNSATPNAQPLGVRTRLVRAAHGDASGVRGAAWLWGDNREETGPNRR
jgi:fructokinase